MFARRRAVTPGTVLSASQPIPVEADVVHLVVIWEGPTLQWPKWLKSGLAIRSNSPQALRKSLEVALAGAEAQEQALRKQRETSSDQEK